MAKIHELIPAESDKVAAANALQAEAINTFAKKQDHFMGQIRDVQMYDERRAAENTREQKEVVETVDSKLAHVWESLAPAIDVTVTKENSNTAPDARANVTIGGKIILGDVPATALLAMEKQLAKLRDLYTAIPTLDPSLTWEPDSNAALPGVMRSKYAMEQHKTEKVPEVITLAPPTDKHPAQTQLVTMDKNVGKISTFKFSGNVSPARKAEWLRRITTLHTAVKEARQRANMAEVLPLTVAESIRTFIHGES